MAYSIDGIPDQLISNPSKDLFLSWLGSIPMPWAARQNLIAAYSRHTGIKFSASDYLYLKSLVTQSGQSQPFRSQP